MDYRQFFSKSPTLHQQTQSTKDSFVQVSFSFFFTLFKYNIVGIFLSENARGDMSTGQSATPPLHMVVLSLCLNHDTQRNLGENGIKSLVSLLLQLN